MRNYRIFAGKLALSSTKNIFTDFMKTVFLTIILTVLIGLNLFSQSNYQHGYIQINEFDTIFGLINYKDDKSNTKICYFKKSENDSVQQFTPEDVYGYRFNRSKYYVSKEISSNDGIKTIFVEYLVRGTVDLFFYRDNFGEHYLVQKQGTPLKEISYDDKIIYIDDKPRSREYLINRGLLKYYLLDCPEIYGEIEEIKKPSHSELMQLIKKYHDIKCPDDVCVQYKKKMPAFRIDVQGIYGISKIDESLFLYNTIRVPYKSQFGVLTYLWLPLSNERIFFRSGILISETNEIIGKIENFDSTTYFYGYNNYCRIPLQFQYIFQKYRISPTFGGGLNMYFTHDKPFPIYPAFNIGVNAKLSDEVYFSLYYDFDYMGKYYFIPDKSTSIISNSFNFGLTFRM